MKNIRLKFLSLCIVLLSLGCGGGSGPELTVTSPSDNSEYVAGDSFKVTGTATSEIGLAGLDVFSSTLGLDGKFTMFDDNTNVRIDVDITINPATPSGEYLIEIRAFDLENNVTTAERTINIL